MFRSTRSREVPFDRSLGRSLAFGILAAAMLGGASAQEVTSPRTLDEVFVKLGQLQDANLGIARQMSETQRRAAAIIQATLDDGQISSPTHREIGKAFISNALTLASIVLAPVATQEVAAGDQFMSLLRRNLIMIENARPLVAQDADLAAAMKQYSVLQMQTQDLAVALRNGWNRYGETLTTAEVSGMLRPGSFDPAGKSWSLQLPPLVKEPVATSDLTFESGADAADVYGEIGLQEVAPGEPSPARPAAQPEAPLPALGGATAPQSEPIVTAPASPGVGGGAPISGWTVTTDEGGRVAAVAANIDAGTADRIKLLQISCHPNGTLRYFFDAADEFPEYFVYANQTDRATVRAASNTVSGGEALKMSDTLRLAFEWATRDPGSNGRLVISPGDEADVRAQFSVEGYIEARGKVLDACQPWEEEPGAVGDALPGGESPRGAPAELRAPVPYPRPRNRDLGGA